MAQSRLVLIAGIPRSGSTWMFNAARVLLGKQGPLVSGWIEDVDTSNCDETTTLIKIHEFDEPLAQKADVILTSRRDLTQIAASVARMGWTSSDQDSIKFLESILNQHRDWAGLSNYEMTYEQMTGDRAAEVHRIAAALGIQVDTSESQQIASEIAKLRHTGPAGTYSPDSLLHPEHVGGSADAISSTLAKTIRSNFKEWLERYGY